MTFPTPFPGTITETVTVTPLFGMDGNGDPIPPGAPVVLTPIVVAPGNTMWQPNEGGELDEAEFTVYLQLADAPKVADNYGIEVRGRDCLTRVRVWNANPGGVEVLCRSATGAS